LIALNCALRNGDAHLKNFAVLYDDVRGEAHLAPAYDIVTTTVYLPQDRMALTLNGKNLWPSAKDLARFAESRSLGSPKDIKSIFEKIADAMTETSVNIAAYAREHPAFHDVAVRMNREWTTGLASIQA
jgi:serine/threonine-protein kinase HipA